MVDAAPWVVTLEVLDVPPSLNTVATKHWRVFMREKRKWQTILEAHLMCAQLPRGLTRIHATASLRFPVQRRRDEGNFRWMLEKALGDALTNGGWLTDDTAAEFTTGEVVFEAERGPRRTMVALTITR